MVIEKLENVNKSKPQVGERIQQVRCACKGSQLLRLFGVVVGPLGGGAYLEEAVFSGSGLLYGRPSPTFCLLAEY